MKNGWTGGQYSLYRATLGVYLLVQLAMHPPWATGAALLALPLLLGWGDRVAAALLLGLWIGFHPDAFHLALPLAVHVVLPAAPFGSWAARGRVDPGGGWSMRPWIYGAAWWLTALGYGHYGYAHLGGGESPLLALAMLYAPLSLVRRARPWLWLAMGGALAGLSPATLVVHLLVFDPAWIRAARPGERDLVFYDGGCGMCHSSIRLLLAEARRAGSFRFAPLEGETFERSVDAERRRALPDSIVLLTPGGELRTRSRAVARCLARLGGAWRVLGGVLSAVPRPVADRGYDLVAAVRSRLFRKPPDVCPVVPPSLRDRFEP